MGRLTFSEILIDLSRSQLQLSPLETLSASEAMSVEDGEVVRGYGRYRCVIDERRDGDRDRTVRIRATAGMVMRCSI